MYMHIAHLTADADAEAEQVLSGTCRHGRKRDECRECKEHSPDKKPDKNLLASKNNPDMKYVGKITYMHTFIHTFMCTYNIYMRVM